MVCAGRHPLDSQNKALQSLHTILALYCCLAPLAGREASCPLCLSQAYAGSYLTDKFLNMSLTVLM